MSAGSILDTGGAGLMNPKAASPARSRQIDVEGKSFHVIEQGERPAVPFCHGFPDTAGSAAQ